MSMRAESQRGNDVLGGRARRGETRAPFVRRNGVLSPLGPQLPTPRWRRRNANGIPGIVSGVRFERKRRSDRERALA